MTKLCFFVVNFFLLKKKTTFVQETSEMGKENVWRACQQISAERGYKKRSPTYSCILNPNGALAFRRTWIVARQPNMPRHDTRLQTPSFKWTRMRNERLFSIIVCVVMVLFFRASLFTLLLASIRYIYAIAPDYPLRECKTNRRRKVARRELFKEEKVNEKIEQIVKSKEWGVKR